MDGQEGGQASGQDHVLSHADTLTENSVANRCVKEESFTAFKISAIFIIYLAFLLFLCFNIRFCFFQNLQNNTLKESFEACGSFLKLIRYCDTGTNKLG